MVAETMLPLLWVIPTVIGALLLYLYMASRNLTSSYGYEIFNPLSFNVGIYILTGVIGSFIILAAPEDLQINEMVNSFASQELRWTAVVLMVYGVAVFALPLYWRTFRLVPPADPVPGARCRHSFSFVLLGILIVAGIVLASYDRITSIGAIIGGGLDQWEIMKLRADLEESEKAGYFLRRTVLEGAGWIFVIYLSRVARPRYLLGLLCIVFSLYFIGSLAKIKLVTFWLSLYMASHWNKRVELKRLLGLGVLILAVLLVVWRVLVGNSEMQYLFSVYSEGLVGRIMISELGALYPHLAIFGDTEAHLGLTSLSATFNSWVGLEPVARSGRTVLEVVSPSWLDMGIGGVFNTVFFGEAYANFSYPGLVLSPLWIVLFYLVVFKASALLEPRMRLAFLIHVALNTTMMSGFNDFLYNPFLVVNFFIAWAWSAAWRERAPRVPAGAPQ